MTEEEAQACYLVGMLAVVVARWGSLAVESRESGPALQRVEPSVAAARQLAACVASLAAPQCSQWIG